MDCGDHRERAARGSPGAGLRAPDLVGPVEPRLGNLDFINAVNDVNPSAVPANSKFDLVVRACDDLGLCTDSPVVPTGTTSVRFSCAWLPTGGSSGRRATGTVRSGGSTDADASAE